LTALAVVGVVACGNGSTTHVSADARPAAFRDADIYDTADAPIPQQQLPDCPASCDDQNPCTTDSCDPETHLCRNDPTTDGTTCVSTDLCSLAAACKSGLCVGTKTKDCTLPSDQCHEEGYCVPTTGLCGYPNSKDGKTCDDGNLCTTGDQCVAGVCQAAPVQCGPGVICDPKTGQCPGFPTPIWGFVLDPSAAPAGIAAFNDLQVSPSGGLYFTLSFANTLDLGAGPMSTTSSAASTLNPDFNVVVARLDPSIGKSLWSRSWGDKSNQVGASIAVNASEIVLVSGAYFGKIDFGPVAGIDAGSVSFTNLGTSPKVFLVALDGASNTILWARSVDVSTTTSASSAHTRVVVDPHDNNFILCASPSKAVTDLSSTTKAGGKGDALVAKLSAQNGQVLWVEQFGSAADESCDGVAADDNGKVYITGKLSQGSALDLGNGKVLAGPPGPAQKAVYVAQLDGVDGTVKWDTAFYNQGKTTGAIAASALVSDGTSVWLAGGFSYTAVFDQTAPLVTIASSGGVDGGTSDPASTSAFVVSLNALSGTVQWSKNWGVNAQVLATALTSSGSIVVCGNYQSGMLFDTGALADSAGNPVPFVAKLNAATGRTVAARGYAAAAALSSPSYFQSMAVDQSKGSSTRDVSYAIGVLTGGLDLGSPVGELPALSSAFTVSPSTPTLLLAKFSP
jgi:hypothetical protein